MLSSPETEGRCSLAVVSPPQPLSGAAPRLTNVPSPTICLSRQKEGNSKTARSKTLAPASPEKKAEGSSASSDELPARQVGQALSLRTLRLRAGWWARAREHICPT